MSGPVDAVILAGSRPEGDPLALEAKATCKAVIPVAGVPMVGRVARTLRDHSGIASVTIMAQQPGLIRKDPALQWLCADQNIIFAQSRGTIAQTIKGVLADPNTRFPLLVTTADNALLSGPMIDSFLRQMVGCDVGLAMVERKTLLAAYPASRRTWLKFRGGQYSGANLFYVGSKKALTVVDLWEQIEQDRKKAWKTFSIFGPRLLLLAGLRILSFPEVLRRASKNLDVTIRMAEMPQPEACIDVDKMSDLALVEEILT